MLEELRQAVDEAGVGDRFSIFRRAWQESWDGIMMDYTQETRLLEAALVAPARMST